MLCFGMAWDKHGSSVGPSVTEKEAAHCSTLISSVALPTQSLIHPVFTASLSIGRSKHSTSGPNSLIIRAKTVTLI